MVEVAIKAKDLLYLSLAIFEVPNPRAVVQIIHGAKDHKDSYYAFASYLNQNGFNVILGDLRGHGKSINGDYPLGYINTGEELIQDEKVVINYIKTRYPNLDIYLFGHSLGSIIARLYLQNNDSDIKKIVLSGPINYSDDVRSGLVIANGILKLGKRKPSELLENFGKLNDPKHLMYDTQALGVYVSDPLVRFHYASNSMWVIFSMIKELRNYKAFKCSNPDIKFFNISGANDELTLGIKGLEETKKSLEHVGYKYIISKEYPERMHEIIKDRGKEEIYYDIASFYLN